MNQLPEERVGPRRQEVYAARRAGNHVCKTCRTTGRWARFRRDVRYARERPDRLPGTNFGGLSEMVMFDAINGSELTAVETNGLVKKPVERLRRRLECVSGRAAKRAS